ncbi:hypothetical protein OSB04_013820 [Centaurea solstitialis]|uniref:Sulfotransferase n=1 Tax=Centaurea solstitialis TaxID=347529 RepID=A0AA38WRH2_9ASTR|nr:hypothetical protein OSB04_013820 [Centaurea solstitialis]
MSSPIVFYSPVAIVTKDEEKARKEKMSIFIEKYKDRVLALPKDESWMMIDLRNYQGFWYSHGVWNNLNANFSVEAIMALQDDFQAQPTDVFLASHAKSGTTWLKALAFAIMNRTKFKLGNCSSLVHPLRNISPHDCVPFIETESFLNNPSYANGLMATHISYTSLPESIISSGCPIVYICRNPKDVFVSSWHFMNKLKDNSSDPMELENVFDLFIKGNAPNGPLWDHVVGYRKASLERPDKVLFLKYEEIQKDANNEVKKLAEFIGYPFTKEEEAAGEIEEVIKLCSFEKLREASKANKDGDETSNAISDEIYFRKGKVGDSVNYLTTEMIQILDKITKKKYDGLDISFVLK